MKKYISKFYNSYCMDWKNFENDVGEWSIDNFGEQPSSNPLIGSMEERSELVKNLLSDEDDIDEEKDAVGDILVYLADFCYRTETPYHKAAQLRNDIELWTDCSDIFKLCTELSISQGDQSYSFLKQDQGIRSEREGVGDKADIRTLAHTLKALEEFSHNRGYTLEDCVEEAWGEVKEREWDSNYKE
jgi:hypothetical protein